MATSSNEQIADKLRIYAVNLIQTGAGFYRTQVVSLLQSIETKLIGRLASSGIESKGQLTDFERRRVQQLLDFVQNTIQSTYTDISAKHAEFLQEIGTIESSFIAATVNKSIGIDLLTAAVPPEKIKGIIKHSPVSGAPSATWWKRQAEALRQKFEDVVRQGMFEGKTNDQLVQAVRGTRANSYKDGIMESSYRDAKALVRSSVLTVSNKTRLDSLSDMARGNPGLFKAVQQVSTLDGRTTDICIAYSGMMWTLPDYEPIGDALPFNGGPPRHWNCRSTIVPVTSSWEDLGIDAAEVPPSTRSSMDGQVAEDITFDQWLKTKPQSFQDELLGPGRADLWRQGKISLTDLIERNGKKVRTLEELRNLHKQ